MAGLVPAIHVLMNQQSGRCGQAKPVLLRHRRVEPDDDIVLMPERHG
jgi:hypothetical protein